MILAELNTPGSRLRSTLAENILSRRVDLSTDNLPDETVEFLLARLRYGEHGLLGTAASEAFVRDRLLPLLPGAKGPLAASLREVLREAGRRHGRRYAGDPVAKRRVKK
jgi:hypothetical protein